MRKQERRDEMIYSPKTHLLQYNPESTISQHKLKKMKVNVGETILESSMFTGVLGCDKK